MTTALSLLAAGCGDVTKPITSAVRDIKKSIVGGPLAPGEHLKGFIGGVVADEPLAALAAREVLATDGNAADAAVTLGFMLAVTLPSRASLGAGGACVAYQPGANAPGHGRPEAILFVPRAPAVNAGDRPAAVPMLARGLYLLNARYGSKPIETLIGPAEAAATRGFSISLALARDLAAVQGPFLSDPSAAAIFAPGGQALGEGARLIQTDLGLTLTQLSRVGVGDLYQGLLAQRLVEASLIAGGPIASADLYRATASLANPLIVRAGDDEVAFVPPPADGGLGAAAALLNFEQSHQVTQAMSDLAAGTVAAWRAQTAGSDPLSLLQNPGRATGTLPALPASTSFVVVDRKGGAVACAITMDNLFGTGRFTPGMGILLAASPAIKPLAELTAGIAWSSARDAFRAGAAASGQNGAALGGAVAMGSALAGDLPPRVPVPEPGRANAIGCTAYLPGDPQSCRFSSDVRNAGLAAGGG